MKKIFATILMAALAVACGTNAVNNEGFVSKIVSNYKTNANILFDESRIKAEKENGDYRVVYDSITPAISTYFNLKYDRSFGENETPLDLHTLGEQEYIVNKLIFDKSKGNDFAKIDEYLKNNREEVFKAFLGDEFKDGVDIKFDLLVLRKIGENEYYSETLDNRYSIQNGVLVNKVLEGDVEKPANFKEEKDFFTSLTKYEDIDWEKYIDFMQDYPVLVMYVQRSTEADIQGGNDGLDTVDADANNEAIRKIYKDLEQFYNKDSFGILFYQR